jgi:pimeloyl-ACP methyl ester carboxylesterase
MEELTMDFSGWNYKVEGEGCPLLFINGHFQSRSSWDPTSKDLSRFYKVITFEFPNQGDSPTDSGMNTIRGYARFAQQFIEFLAIPSEQMIVHGYSFGGNVLRVMSQELGMKFRAIIYGGIPSLRLAPFQIRRFSTWIDLLDSTNFLNFARNVLLQVFSPDFVARYPHFFDTMVADYCRYYEKRPEAVRALVLAMLEAFQNPLAAKEKYDCPVYVLGAEADLLLPMNYVEEYGREIGAIRTVMLPGGHGTRIEQHERLAEAISQIAARHELAEAAA